MRFPTASLRNGRNRTALASTGCIRGAASGASSGCVCAMPASALSPRLDHGDSAHVRRRGAARGSLRCSAETVAGHDQHWLANLEDSARDTSPSRGRAGRIRAPSRAELPDDGEGTERPRPQRSSIELHSIASTEARQSAGNLLRYNLNILAGLDQATYPPIDAEPWSDRGVTDRRRHSISKLSHVDPCQFAGGAVVRFHRVELKSSRFGLSAK